MNQEPYTYNDASNNLHVEDLMPKKPSKGYAVTSLVLGIVSLVCCCLTSVSLICAVLAIIFAVVSRRQNGTFSGMATAGLVCGIVAATFGVVSIISSILNPVSDADLQLLLEQYMAMLEEMTGAEGKPVSAIRALFR